MNEKNSVIPYVIEKRADGERTYDLYSRLLEDRIVMLCGEVTDQSVNSIIGQLLFLNAQDPKAPIFLYIQSPGGSVQAGLSLCDTMNYISAPVYTIALGTAASMGFTILSAGEKGHRYCLKSSSLLIHEMMGGTEGRTRDNIIAINYEKKLKAYLLAFIAHNCGRMTDKAFEEVKSAYYKPDTKDPNMVVKFSKETTKQMKAIEAESDYDHWLFPEEALAFGVVDKILESEADIQ